MKQDALRGGCAAFLLDGWVGGEIVLLWTSIVATTIALFRVSRTAGMLFVPYLGWVTFAAALNFSIWRLNGGQRTN